MRYLPLQPIRAGVVMTAAATLAACGGGDSTSSAAPPIPQLSAAIGTTFTGDCATLQSSLATLANTKITGASTVAAGTLTVGGTSIGEHCLVTGKMFERTSTVDGNGYAIGFEMRMPKNWNGRFLYQGNGGTDGAVVTATGATGGGPITNALLQGFAVLSSDAGHSGSTPNFGIDPQARLDYGYQAVGKLTPMAKSAIQIAYGKGPDRSYFSGCSNGGRHALVAAARYFADYDGILAGAPGYNLPKAAVANLAGARLYASVATVPVTDQISLATSFTNTERQLITQKVLAKCDALDGAADGMIQDVASCQTAFKPAADLPVCTGARDGTCLSADQIAVFSKIFSGTTTSNGTLIYASFPFDAGYSAGASGVASGGSPVGSGVPFWEFYASTNLDSGSTGIIFKVPPEDPASFAPFTFSLTTDIDALYAGITATNATYTESAMTFMTPPNPTKMFGLRDRGGKIMVYHGVSDPIFSVNDSEAWYKGLTADSGDKFAKFYRVPGMGHCSGGPSTDQFDMLTPLVNWVEKGTAPAEIIATARGTGNVGGINTDVPASWAVNRTRPLCPYPKVARYSASGSLEVASSFVCE